MLEYWMHENGDLGKFFTCDSYNNVNIMLWLQQLITSA